MSRTKKAILITISAIAVALCIFCCLYIYQFFRGSKVNDQVSQLALAAETVTVTPEAPEVLPEPEEPETEAEPVEPEIPTVSIDIDFDALAEVNEEIYAWLEVPGTSISQPILQSQTDDLFYNSHGVDKAYYSGGAVYTQRYNSLGFDDPMTLVYGHNFHDQSIFAPLLNFADAAFFETNRNFYVYTPETVYEYRIFAAYPHTSEHLLLCYDWTDEAVFDSYFGSLTDGVNANYDREAFPAFGDRVLTLSTCYRLSRGQRFLVQGVLTATYAVAQEEG